MKMAPRDPVKPFLGAVTCFIIYWVLWNLLIPPARFLGGEMVADTIPLLVAATAASALAMAIFESRGLSDLGLAWRANISRRNLFMGIALGVGGAALLILPCIPLGLAHFERVPNADSSWVGALFAPLFLLCGAAGEEILFRGFMLQYMIRGYGSWAGILGIGAVFGLLHAGNPGATTISIVNTAGFGVLFGAALLRSHDLWLPLGIHFGWNATLPFLGVALSGLTIRVTEYRLVWTAADLWSGGKYGPEASILASGVLVVLALAIWKIPVLRSWAWLLDGKPDEDAADPPEES
jgi:membrane protease YdiL (CAAX protease family)